MITKRIINLESGFKLLDGMDGPGSFTGYASTFANWDRVGEKPTPGSFRNLKDFVSAGFISWGHDWNLPVAVVDEVKEDEVGIWIKGTFHSTQQAQEIRTIAAERLNAGKSLGLSIGYRVHDAKRVSGGVLLTDIELFEVGIVTVPANPEATLLSIKGLPDGLTLDEAYESALAVVSGLQERIERLSELRSDEGRVLSERHCGRIKSLSNALLALVPPDPPTEPGPDPLSLMKLRSLAVRASLLSGALEI